MRTKPTRQRGTAGSANFSRVLGTVKEAGLLGRQRGFYITMLAVLGVALGGIIVGSIFLGESWFQLLLAAALGVVLTQISFITHEAAHRQIFVSGPANDRTGRFLANAIVGISYQWWMNKHTRHHANPNTIGKDPDIERDTISFTPEDASVQRGISGWITRRQGYLFFPLLTLEGINLHWLSLRYLFTAPKVKNRVSEIVTIALRISIYLTAVFMFLPVGMAFAFVGVQLAVFGVYMGGSFAPNHKGMPLIDRVTTVDFLSRQVLTSRNIMGSTRAGNLWLTMFYGGLNYQVEHHLFPNMPRLHLMKASEIVRKHCAEVGVPYTVATVRESYSQVIAYLNRVGISGRDPFDCPMVSQFRPSGV